MQNDNDIKEFVATIREEMKDIHSQIYQQQLENDNLRYKIKQLENTNNDLHQLKLNEDQRSVFNRESAKNTFNLLGKYKI